MKAILVAMMMVVVGCGRDDGAGASQRSVPAASADASAPAGGAGSAPGASADASTQAGEAGSGASPAGSASDVGSDAGASKAADCISADAGTCRIEAEVLRLTNGLRAENGLAALTLDPKLAFVARAWSSEQARAGDISHDGFPARRSALYRATFGVDAKIAAENVAMEGGRGGAELAQVADLFDLWSHSPGHRANMLGTFKTLGVGIAHDGAGGDLYGTQIFAR